MIHTSSNSQQLAANPGRAFVSEPLWKALKLRLMFQQIKELFTAVLTLFFFKAMSTPTQHLRHIGETYSSFSFYVEPKHHSGVTDPFQRLR